MNIMTYIVVKVHSSMDAEKGARNLTSDLLRCGIQVRLMPNGYGMTILMKECQVDFVNVSRENVVDRLKGLRPDAVYRFNGGSLGRFRLGQFWLDSNPEQDGRIEPDIFKLIVSKEKASAYYVYPSDLKPEKLEELKAFLSDRFEEVMHRPLFMLATEKERNNEKKNV